MPFPAFTSPLFENIPQLVHGFTARDGGVSEGTYASLNLGWDTGDDDERVEENYRRLASSIGMQTDRILSVHQVHGTEVFPVESSPDTQHRISKQADAMVSSLPGVCLSVRVADCVPILLADPAHHVVAAVHAGWRGTLEGVLGATIEAMKARYETRPGDLFLAAGPAIGKCCFEVQVSIAQLFRLKAGLEDGETASSGDEKAKLDLVAVNLRLARQTGLKPDRMWSSGLCTKCHPELFFLTGVTGSDRGET